MPCFTLLRALQMSKIERMQLQILCDDVVQEFDAASQKVPWLLRRMAQLLCFARTRISSYASLPLPCSYSGTPPFAPCFMKKCTGSSKRRQPR